jgi:hypothetical protein
VVRCSFEPPRENEKALRHDPVRDFLVRTDVVVEFRWDWRYGGPSFKALVPIGVGRGYAGDFVCLDLARDPAEYASLSSEELANETTVGPKARPICAIRLNGVPIVFDHNDPLVIGRVPVESRVLAERAHHRAGVPRISDALPAVGRRCVEPRVLRVSGSM